MVKVYKDSSILHFFSNFDKKDKLCQDVGFLYNDDQIFTPLESFLCCRFPIPGLELNFPDSKHRSVS